jgi:hypothetical protein
MLNLKLADYGEKKEKFERFLELGKDFLFGGEWIQEIYRHHKIESSEMAYTTMGNVYHKDEKDPLNRLNDRFNNRSYGKGRFVLIKNDEDNVYETKFAFLHRIYTFRKVRRCVSSGVIGNLHENPELYEKITSIY